VDLEEKKKKEQDFNEERERNKQRKAEEYDKRQKGAKSPKNQNVDSSRGTEQEESKQSNLRNNRKGNRENQNQEVPKREQAPTAVVEVLPISPALQSVPNAHHDKEVENWSLEDISNWLHEITFGVLSGRFKDNDIDGEALLLMRFEDLKDLNINLGSRLKLWRQIEEIGGQIRKEVGSTRYYNKKGKNTNKHEQPQAIVEQPLQSKHQAQQQTVTHTNAIQQAEEVQDGEYNEQQENQYQRRYSKGNNNRNYKYRQVQYYSSY